MNRETFRWYRDWLARSYAIDKLTTDRKLKVSDECLSGKLVQALEKLPPGSKVLEVGAGRGNTLDEIRRRFPHLKVYGTNYDLRANVKGTVSAEASKIPFKGGGI